MAKGNINYKYLKRRRSWFHRNKLLVVLIAVSSVIVISGIAYAILMLMDKF